MFIIYLLAEISTARLLQHLIDEHVSLVSQFSGYEKLVYDPFSQRIKFTGKTLKPGKIGTVQLRKCADDYYIQIDDKYLNLELDTAKLVPNMQEGTPLNIIPTANGFKVMYKNRCLTNSLKKKPLLKPCLDNQNPDSVRQDFEFKRVGNSFIGNFMDTMCRESTSNSSFTEEDTPDNELNLEKTFRESVYDKPFVDSMKYFYNYAACTNGKQKLK